MGGVSKLFEKLSQEPWMGGNADHSAKLKGVAALRAPHLRNWFKIEE
jgi:hypothetical protein